MLVQKSLALRKHTFLLKYKWIISTLKVTRTWTVDRIVIKSFNDLLKSKCLNSGNESTWSTAATTSDMYPPKGYKAL
jgi:hypothetical protein